MQTISVSETVETVSTDNEKKPIHCYPRCGAQEKLLVRLGTPIVAYCGYTLYRKARKVSLDETDRPMCTECFDIMMSLKE